MNRIAGFVDAGSRSSGSRGRRLRRGRRRRGQFRGPIDPRQNVRRPRQRLCMVSTTDNGWRIHPGGVHNSVCGDAASTRTSLRRIQPGSRNGDKERPLITPPPPPDPNMAVHCTGFAVRVDSRYFYLVNRGRGVRTIHQGEIEGCYSSWIPAWTSRFSIGFRHSGARVRRRSASLAPSRFCGS